MMWNRHVPPELRYRPSRVLLIVDGIALAVLALIVVGLLFADAFDAALR